MQRCLINIYENKYTIHNAGMIEVKKRKAIAKKPSAVMDYNNMIAGIESTSTWPIIEFQGREDKGILRKYFSRSLIYPYGIQ